MIRDTRAAHANYVKWRKRAERCWAAVLVSGGIVLVGGIAIVVEFIGLYITWYKVMLGGIGAAIVWGALGLIAEKLRDRAIGLPVHPGSSKGVANDN